MAAKGRGFRRRTVVTGLAVAALPTLPAWARGGGAPLVATLDTASEGPRTPLWAAFRERLAELGFGGATVESRWGDGAAEAMPRLAADLVVREPDVIATAGTLSALSARNATRRIPVVIVTSGDPVRLGLVANLARPGGNVTGLVSLEELSAKRLGMIRELVPGVRRIAVFWNAASPSAERLVDDARAASSVDLVIEPYGIAAVSDLDRAFAAAARAGMQAAILPPSPAFYGERQRIARLALEARLPLVTGHREYVEAGALAGYAASIPGQFRKAADIVARILRGADPAEIPLEQPTGFDLVLNLRTAAALGLALPPRLLGAATDLVE